MWLAIKQVGIGRIGTNWGIRIDGIMVRVILAASRIDGIKVTVTVMMQKNVDPDWDGYDSDEAD